MNELLLSRSLDVFVCFVFVADGITKLITDC
jgi:hypothetical protein